MEQRQRRLSIAISLVAWTGQRDSRGSISGGETSPKEEPTFPVQVVEEASIVPPRSSSPTPLPVPPQLPEVPPAPYLSRNMTEPTRPPSIAVSTLSRHHSQPPPPFHPTTPLDLRTPETSLPNLTTCQKALLSFKRLFKIPFSISARRKKSPRKHNAEKRATHFVVYTLLLFCVTAISCTPSLPSLSIRVIRFPNSSN
jgi:hypothetical protein